MTNGVGKYNAELTLACEAASATSGILIVLDGTRGSGFAVQAEAGALLVLPATLRRVADMIEADLTVLKARA